MVGFMAQPITTYRDFLKSLTALIKAVPAMELPGVVAITFKSDYLLAKSIGALSHAAHGHLPVERYDASQISTLGLSDKLAQRGMFSDRTMIVIERAEKASELLPCLAALTTADDLAASLILVFSGAINAKTQKELTRLKAAVIYATPPEGDALADFCQSLAKKLGLSLARDAVQTLIEETDGNLGRLDNELAKLALLFNGETRTLTRDDLPIIAADLVEAQVFHLDQFILNGDTVGAHSHLKRLLDQGQAPIAILGMLTRCLRISLLLASAKHSGGSMEQAASAYRLPSFIARKYSQFAASRPLAQLQQAMGRCQKLDAAFKSGGQSCPELDLMAVVQSFA